MPTHAAILGSIFVGTLGWICNKFGTVFSFKFVVLGGYKKPLVVAYFVGNHLWIYYQCKVGRNSLILLISLCTLGACSTAMRDVEVGLSEYLLTWTSRVYGPMLYSLKMLGRSATLVPYSGRVWGNSRSASCMRPFLKMSCCAWSFMLYRRRASNASVCIDKFILSKRSWPEFWWDCIPTHACIE